jgi:hypothetical protein
MAALLDRFQLRRHAVPDHAVPCCILPSGILPSGILPPGILPVDILPPGILPLDIIPPGILPSGLLIQLDREIDRRRACAVLACPGDRPRLVATWHPGTDGHPVCAWSVSEGVLRPG